MSEGVKVKPSSAGLDRPSLNILVAAAHELKAPLTIIAHIAEVTEMDIENMTLDESQAAIRRIKLSAQRSLKLMQGLTISQRLVGSDQLSLGFELEPLNASQVCEEVVQESLPLAAAQFQAIAMYAPPSPQLVIGNRELLRSVFFNLIDNAIKHNPAEKEVQVKLGRHKDMVRVSVHDNGPKLNKADLRNLSDSIGKELQPVHGRTGNSGLGLYIAGLMVSSMGGFLNASRADNGTSFYVDLIRSQQLSII